MPIVAARALARVIDISSTKLGVPLPKAYLATLAQAQRLITETEQLEAGAGELTSRACELILKGDDPRTDPQIARLLAQRGLAANGIRVAGADRGQGLITAALVEHADEILSGWAEELTADCAPVTPRESPLPNCGLAHIAAPGSWLIPAKRQSISAPGIIRLTSLFSQLDRHEEDQTGRYGKTKKKASK